jgi:hypothetical protein
LRVPRQHTGRRWRPGRSLPAWRHLAPRRLAVGRRRLGVVPSNPQRRCRQSKHAGAPRNGDLDLGPQLCADSVESKCRDEAPDVLLKHRSGRRWTKDFSLDLREPRRSRSECRQCARTPVNRTRTRRCPARRCCTPTRRSSISMWSMPTPPNTSMRPPSRLPSRSRAPTPRRCHGH